jgi:integrase/recombinase XerD
VHPFTARRHDVDAWVAHLTRCPQPATGRSAAPATVVRRLSCLSGFYDYGLREVELLGYSPVANVRRPRVAEDSPTIGLDAAELDRLLGAAERDSPRSAALIPLLVYNGLRINEALSCDVTAITYQRGHRVLRIVRKGGRAATEPLAPVVLHRCSTTSVNGSPVACFSTGTAAADWRTATATHSSGVSPVAPASPPPTT